LVRSVIVLVRRNQKPSGTQNAKPTAEEKNEKKKKRVITIILNESDFCLERVRK